MQVHTVVNASKKLGESYDYIPNRALTCIIFSHFILTNSRLRSYDVDYYRSNGCKSTVNTKVRLGWGLVS